MNEPKPVHPGSFCSIEGATGAFKTGRAGICSAKKPGDRLRWRAAEHAPALRPSRSNATAVVTVPAQQILTLDQDARPAPPSWEDLGSPMGPPPVGSPISHCGGTYELLPGEPRRYRVSSVDGRDISGTVVTTPGRNQTAEDARTALRMDELHRDRTTKDQASAWRKALGDVTGSWDYSTEDIKGFDEATPAERTAIKEALHRWTGYKVNLADVSRMAEPHVNSVIRGVAPPDQDAERDIAALDRAFTMSKTNKPITVYRGFSNGAHLMPADWRDRDLTGLEWTVPQFTPTTADRDVADFYVGVDTDHGFGIRLHLPAGFPAIAIPDEVGGLDNEAEILLPRNLGFRTVNDNGVQGEHNQRWLDVEVYQTTPGGS